MAVARLTLKEMKAEPNLGKGAIAALEAWLAGHGLTFAATNGERRLEGRRSDSRKDDNSNASLPPMQLGLQPWKDVSHGSHRIQLRHPGRCRPA